VNKRNFFPNINKLGSFLFFIFYCLLVDTCLGNSNLCNGNGLCSMNANGQMECLCFLGFYGYNCSFDGNLCSTGICKNNGTCRPVYYNADGYVCDCLPGFTGKNCESNEIFVI
jgi:hypothetical protein